MIKKAYHYIAFLTLVVGALLAACTRNDGDIGSKFGEWKLTAMTIDGQENPAYARNIFWGFQSGSLSFRLVTYVEGIPEYNETFAQWSESDGYIVLDTDFSDDQGTFRYSPPEVLLIPWQTSGIRLKIISETSSYMVLEYAAADGSVIRYHLQKWG